MNFLGEHWPYIAGAYAATLAAVAALIGWIVTDARRQEARLAALEAQGIRRRSDRTA